MPDINANRPGYKKTKIGWIPAEWEVNRLENIVDPKRKISYGIVQTGEPIENGIKCIRVVDLKANGIDPNELITTSEQISNSYRKTVLRKGDLVIALRGKIGQLAIIDDKLVGANLTRGVALLAVRPEYSNRYIYQLLSSPLSEMIFLRRLSGSALQELSIGVLRKIPVASPPLPEQKKIAAILSTWDAAIQKLEQLIDKKRALKRGLMQQLLTGQRRFPEFVPAGGTRYKRTKLGLAPVDWEVVRLGSKVKVFSGGTPKSTNPDFYDGAIPWIRSGELNNHRVNKTEKSITESGLKNSSAKIVEPGTLLLALYGATAGVVSVTNIKAAINQAILAVIPKSDLDKSYLEFYLRWYSAKLVHKFTQGGQPNLSATNVKSQVLSLPPFVEQRRIAKCLAACDSEIIQLETEKKRLQLQKKGLMQQLLTGAVRVKTTVSQT